MSIVHEVELTLGRNHPTLDETLTQAKQQAGRVRSEKLVRIAVCCTRWPVNTLFQIAQCGLCGQVPVVI